ncbi:division/cell wall cluster transcriptional repressor MraZ [Euryhalocaulis caribicus]|uniref:division/cell wall cluster transcriptional repressor MraZ n=1 Tax=Euryhalocaulis caribicus TaxID=1161401 RepID=UPI0003A93B3A|nr:division/cell wall cluster transcriptional repressor MraZ [Euryhalocaulis caribicus]
MFLSTAETGLDAKNRVSVPADFRAQLSTDPQAAIYTFPHFHGPYLEGGGQAFIDRYARDIRRLKRFDPMRRTMEVAVLGATKRLDFDANGRVTLPKDFIEHAGIDKRVMFVGCGTRFEIWSAEAHEKRMGEARDRAASLIDDPEMAAMFGGEEDDE